MKSWRNKVPLFFGFGAYLTLFWVPAFGTLANLEMHFFQKDLVKPIWKLAKFNLPLPKHQFKSIKPQVPGLRPWCHVWWRVSGTDRCPTGTPQWCCCPGPGWTLCPGGSRRTSPAQAESRRRFLAGTFGKTAGLYKYQNGACSVTITMFPSQEQIIRDKPVVTHSQKELS